MNRKLLISVVSLAITGGTILGTANLASAKPIGPPAPKKSCTMWGHTVNDGESVTNITRLPDGKTIVKTYKCSDGTWELTSDTTVARYTFVNGRLSAPAAPVAPTNATAGVASATTPAKPSTPAQDVTLQKAKVQDKDFQAVSAYIRG